MAPDVLVDSTNVTRTIWRLRWTNVASHHLIWKRWRVTEQTGDPRASQQCKSSSHGVSANWRPNVIYENLVRQPPATFSARSVTGCAVLILDLLHMSSPTRDDETRRTDSSVHCTVINQTRHDGLTMIQGSTVSVVLQGSRLGWVYWSMNARCMLFNGLFWDSFSADKTSASCYCTTQDWPFSINSSSF